MTPSLSVDRDAGRNFNWKQTLIVSWCAIGIGLVASIVGSFWWAQWVALLTYSSTRWQRRALEAEKAVSREAALVHNSVLVFACVLVVVLAILEMIRGRHAPVLDPVWKTGAVIMLVASVIGDFILVRSLRKLNRRQTL